MSRLVNHLVEYIEEVIPLCLFHIFIYSQYIPEFSDHPHLITNQYTIKKINGLLSGRRGTDREIVKGKNIFQLFFLGRVNQFLVDDGAKAFFKDASFG